jgi:hypothetical protein
VTFQLGLWFSVLPPFIIPMIVGWSYPSSIDGGYAVMFGDNSPISLINPAERRMESAKL